MRTTRFIFLASLLTTSSAFAAAPSAPAASTHPTPLPAIKVSDNGRYFVKQGAGGAGDTPFFWLGDTAWCIFNHPSPADVDLYLDDRQAKGFTVIQGCIAVWDHATRRNPDGQTPFTNAGRGATGNPTVNEAFFSNVDAIIDKATARGMYMAILPFWTKNTRSGPFNDPAVMEPYCKFLAKRYASKNVFWVLGGDTAGTDVQPVTDAEAKGLLEGAKEAGVAKIMITFHPTGGQSSSFWFQDRPWLDFNSIQSGHFIETTNFQIVTGDYAKKTTKPTLDMEPGYENITDKLVRTNVTNDTPRIQAVDVRRSAYLAVFAGSAGHSYGNGEVYEFYHPPANGAAPAGNAGWHAPMDWKDALKLPASGQVQFLRYLMESRPPARTPDQSLIVGGTQAVPITGLAGGGRRGPRESALTRIEAIRADDNSFAFVYLPAGQTKVTLDLTKLAPAPLTAWWYDPRTGQATSIGKIPQGPTQNFTAPAPTTQIPATQNDWILVLDNPSKNFPEPGKH